MTNTVNTITRLGMGPREEDSLWIGEEEEERRGIL